MSAAEYRSTAARVRQELPDLDRAAQRALQAWSLASRSTDDLYVDAAALNIHGFYAGLERVFVFIGERIDGSLPSGPTWHQDLLRQMTAELPRVRAAVVDADLFPALDRYRGFRHVVRNVYAYALDPKLVGTLVNDLAQTAKRVHTGLQRFANELETIAAATDD
jgi:hypothetical protein